LVGLIVRVLLFLVAVAILSWTPGGEEIANSEITWGVTLAGALMIMAAPTFLIYLAAAPYRLEKERADGLAEELASTNERLESEIGRLNVQLDRSVVVVVVPWVEWVWLDPMVKGRGDGDDVYAALIPDFWVRNISGGEVALEFTLRCVFHSPTERTSESEGHFPWRRTTRLDGIDWRERLKQESKRTDFFDSPDDFRLGVGNRSRRACLPIFIGYTVPDAARTKHELTLIVRDEISGSSGSVVVPSVVYSGRGLSPPRQWDERVRLQLSAED
jgi:hypothetical protein